MALSLMLKLTIAGASMRSAAAEASVDAADAPSATMEAKDPSGVPDPFSDTWKFIVGGGVANGPRYPGSSDDFTHALPLVTASYGRYFLGAIPGSGAPAGAGAYLLHTEHWAVGVDLGGDFRQPRRATDDPLLSGWGDIPRTARVGMFAGYTMDWLSVRGSISEAVSHHEGVVASFGVEAKYHPMQQLTLSIGPEVKWVNSQYAMTFFGIDAAQSEIANIAPYQAKGGLESLGGSAGASYMLTPHWSVAAHVGYGRLQGDAADSPVTTDKTQRVYGGFVMYRF